ncbi:MAG: hypothetical protein M1821_007078 [Bathelium mastoideum]|nr:MAG: hypothetical protein M1821_007078 [Bathelium mastoideum]
MTSINLSDDTIPTLDGEIAVIVGGATGIGQSLRRLLCARGAKVFVIDRKAQETVPKEAVYINGDITSWQRMREIFLSGKYFTRIDMCFVNAGISEDLGNSLINDAYEPTTGNLLEPNYDVIDVNFKGTLNVIKLTLHLMKKQASGGRIVITSSATGYAPEQVLPVYSASKAALITLIRALRSTLPGSNITVNGVAPAATHTPLLPPDLAAPIMAAGLPVSSSEHVALALAFSATAYEEKQVELYGKELELGPVSNKSNKDATNPNGETARHRWNGRILLTLGDTATELEEPLADLREQYMGEYVTKLTRQQQAMTDGRPF